MITFRKGDVVEALKRGDIDVLAHGCNCVGGFGAGIAEQIAKEFPYAKERYLDVIDSCDEGENVDLLGLIIPVPVLLDEEDAIKGYVANCFTQYHYYPRNKVHVNYKAVESALKNLLVVFPNKRIGMPKIGAGLAGGDWDIIVKIIDETFKDGEVFVYEL